MLKYIFLKFSCYKIHYELSSCLKTFLNSEKSESRSAVSDSWQPHGVYSPWNSPGQNTGVGSLSFLQGTFPTQRLNSVLSHIVGGFFTS